MGQLSCRSTLPRRFAALRVPHRRSGADFTRTLKTLVGQRRAIYCNHDDEHVRGGKTGTPTQVVLSQAEAPVIPVPVEDGWCSRCLLGLFAVVPDYPRLK